VKRGSDNTTTIISPLSAGGVANAAAQDTFCASTTCLITEIYDQSGRNNHLTQAPPGGAASGPELNGYDNLASAIGAPVTLNGQKAYGVFISPGTGYRRDTTTLVATGDAAEGMYAVLDGTHYNDGCCFDYGNAETNNKDTGNGHMVRQTSPFSLNFSRVELFGVVSKKNRLLKSSNFRRIPILTREIGGYLLWGLHLLGNRLRQRAVDHGRSREWPLFWS
jgi:hypothetical protein